MSGRKWKLNQEEEEKIKEYLLHQGGEEKEAKNISEKWRIKFSDSTFTFYTSGTLYSTPSNSQDPAVEEVWDYIDSLVGSVFVQPTREFLIGLDETGKGELVGHTHLVGVIIPSHLFSQLEKIVSTADTKKAHSFEYWDNIFKKISQFIGDGLEYIEEKIPPWHVDRYNLNKIMDVVYQRIWLHFSEELVLESAE